MACVRPAGGSLSLVQARFLPAKAAVAQAERAWKSRNVSFAAKRALHHRETMRLGRALTVLQGFRFRCVRIHLSLKF